MAPPRRTQDAPPPPAPAAAAEQEEVNETPLTDSILADMSAQDLEQFDLYLDGKAKRPLSANLACNGFFKKAPGAQLIGRVMECVSRPSTIDPDVENTILFVQGVMDQPVDVLSKSGKSVVMEKGRYQGVWGFQIDAATMALASAGRGVTIHVKVDELVDLSGGRTRWKYDFVHMG